MLELLWSQLLCESTLGLSHQMQLKQHSQTVRKWKFTPSTSDYIIHIHMPSLNLVANFLEHLRRPILLDVVKVRFWMINNFKWKIAGRGLQRVNHKIIKIKQNNSNNAIPLIKHLCDAKVVTKDTHTVFWINKLWMKFKKIHLVCDSINSTWISKKLVLFTSCFCIP